jgi:hypothetical protein
VCNFCYGTPQDPTTITHSPRTLHKHQAAPRSFDSISHTNVFALPISLVITFLHDLKPDALWALKTFLPPSIPTTTPHHTHLIMASNQQASVAFAPVLSALSTMQSNSSRPQKAHAHEYLEKFQKSVCCTIHPHCWQKLRHETVRSMEHNPQHSAICRCRRRSETFCSHHLERESSSSHCSNHVVEHLLTLLG